MHQGRHDADSYRRVEVITGDRRRRSWSEEEKARIVAESADPDANISEVARRNGVSRGLLTVWRRQARTASYDAPAFAQVRIAAPGADAIAAELHAGADANEKIEIDIAGARVRVPRCADAATLRTVVAALRSAR
jgi:transposase